MGLTFLMSLSVLGLSLTIVHVFRPTFPLWPAVLFMAIVLVLLTMPLGGHSLAVR